MKSRYEGILEPYPDTFEWFFQELILKDSRGTVLYLGYALGPEFIGLETRPARGNRR